MVQIGGHDEVRMYDVTSGASVLPSWKKKMTIKERRQRRLKENEDAASRVQILQDFDMPSVSQRVKCTKDEKFILASGAYPPMVKCYELAELSMKFQRNLDCEIVDFEILGDDWRKVAFLLADRVVELHAQFGAHYKVRVPRFGRELLLNERDADLYICGDGEEVFRLNLEQGRFLAPISTLSGINGGNNCMAMNTHNQLLVFGGENGSLDTWDPRALSSRKPAGVLQVGAGISAVCFDSKDGLNLAVGTSEGQVLLYDIRSSKPYNVKEQGYGMPVRSVKLHPDGKHVISCDAKSIKGWRRDSESSNMFAAEPRSDVNHLCIIGNSGVVVAASETARIPSYYIPALGLAPKWCSFLDNFTEELEGDAQTNSSRTIYENYRFVTIDELKKLNLEQLVGTNLLRGYMHGYFMDLRLWRKANDAVDPFAYEKYRKQKVTEKIEEARASRIAAPVKRRIVKVNQPVIDSTLEKMDKKGSTAKVAAAVLTDNRFKAMFEDEEFTVEATDPRYRRLHPQDAAMEDGKPFEYNSDLEEADRSDEEDRITKALEPVEAGSGSSDDSESSENEFDEGEQMEEELIAPVDSQSKKKFKARLYQVRKDNAKPKEKLSAVDLMKGQRRGRREKKPSAKGRTLGERVREREKRSQP